MLYLGNKINQSLSLLKICEELKLKRKTCLQDDIT